MNDLDQTNMKWVAIGAAGLGLIVIFGLVLATGNLQLLLITGGMLAICTPVAVIMIRRSSAQLTSGRDEDPIKEFMDAYETAESITLEARNFTWIHAQIWAKNSMQPLLMEQLCHQLKLEPQQLAPIFSQSLKSSDSFDRLGCIPLGAGEKFSMLAGLLGKKIEVVLFDGFGNALANVYTCYPDGKFEEHPEELEKI